MEDNLGDIRILQLALKEAGVDCDLTVLRDGGEALAFVRRQGNYANAPCPDLAVLDLILPKCDAIEILEAIRSSDHMRNVPAIILSTLPRIYDAANVERLKIARHITKPSQLSAFLEIGVVLKDFLACQTTPDGSQI